MNLSALRLQELQSRSNLVRQDIISMISKAGSGHPGGSLGITDILVALYFEILKHDPKNPKLPKRDRLILSHGHVCPALYAVLARAGFFPLSDLLRLRKYESPLQGHPHRQSLPGLETTSGPLGCGLSQACGMALGGKMDKADWRVICLMSDGEQDEGNIWEGVMLASKYKLNNLTALIDRNLIQASGKTEEIMPLESLKSKYEAFGWNVIEIDGHNFEQIINSFELAKNVLDKPTAIIVNTIPGKGVSFMENKPEWHSKVLNEEEAKQALKELGEQNG